MAQVIIVGIIVGALLLVMLGVMVMVRLDERPPKRSATPQERRLLDQAHVLLSRMTYPMSDDLDRVDILSERSKKDAVRLLRAYDEMRDEEIGR